MKTLKFVIIISILLCSKNLIPQSSVQPKTKSIDTLMNTNIPAIMAKANVPGAAIAIIKNGQVIYEKGHGHADKNKEVEVGPTTGFNIGSISKLFTAWGIMNLVKKGKLNLDIPVETYLTRWKLPESEFDHNKVTIRALLSHTAGVSVHGYPGFHPNHKLPSLEASLTGENGPIRENEAVKLILEPQTQFKYSGGGYTILQLIIEEVTRQKFENYMQEHVLQPLGLNDTSFTINEMILSKSAKPYDKDGNEIYLEQFTAKAAAGLHTTLKDLAIFAKAQFSENPVLSQETIKEMIQLIPTTQTERGAYGLGYAIHNFGPIKVVGHAGTNTGWEAGFMMDFNDRDGFIVLTNSSNGKKVAMNLLQTWANWRMNK
ncbi:serine hydrolase domain-containing protein [Croceitalea marina]|uniref:Serine hydrolase domain-containing protein n=1 Tax=Croceitalea marina TaxID=1775166 RepID=A0ABW5MTV4_9FLAO